MTYQWPILKAQKSGQIKSVFENTIIGLCIE